MLICSFASTGKSFELQMQTLMQVDFTLIFLSQILFSMRSKYPPSSTKDKLQSPMWMSAGFDVLAYLYPRIKPVTYLNPKIKQCTRFSCNCIVYHFSTVISSLSKKLFHFSVFNKVINLSDRPLRGGQRSSGYGLSDDDGAQAQVPLLYFFFHCKL